ncbi:hypothetical protein BC938DRAFT_472884, partial [Jimgerdemannia flammicorona]
DLNKPPGSSRRTALFVQISHTHTFSSTPTQKMPIPHCELGHASVKVTAIGFGCVGMSEFYGPADEKENIAVLERSINLGRYGHGKTRSFSPPPDLAALAHAMVSSWDLEEAAGRLRGHASV